MKRLSQEIITRRRFAPAAEAGPSDGPPSLPGRDAAAERRGTVIVIVLALLGALALMGFLIYSISAEEEVAAEYFAKAAKVTDPGLDPNAFFNFTLRQIILGADVEERQSALWGGRNSLLPTMLGRDMAPFSGEGVNLVWDGGTNRPVVDRNHNGSDDVTVDGVAENARLFNINLSPAAQADILNLNDLNDDGMANDAYPEPDADYTSFDINSTFLSFDALVPNGANAPVRVIIPSYHRPQILRNLVPSANWYTDPATVGRVLHPHVEHRAIADNGTVTTTRRFVSTAYPQAAEPGADGQPGVAGVDDDSANGVDDAGELGLYGDDIRAMGNFPFPGQPTGPVLDQEGVWRDAPDPAQVDYGADPDGDGIKDAFYMDLHFPLMEVPGSSDHFVAMAAVTIKDADALLNLNVHGGAEGNLNLNAASDFGGAGEFISKSNQGTGPWEVNPEWALNARPLNSPAGDYSGPDLNLALEQHRLLFRDPANRAVNPVNDHEAGVFELANMEWWRLLHGGAQLIDPGGVAPLSESDIQQAYPGRWGEHETRLKGPMGVIVSRTATSAPFPGISLTDDNNNGTAGLFEEGGLWPFQGSLSSYGAFVYPLDILGPGRTTTAGTFGKTRDLATSGDDPGIGNHVWAVHRNYLASNDTGIASSPFIGQLMPGASAWLPVDDPAETHVEPGAANLQKEDSIFGADENLLQLPNAVFKTKLNSPGRAALLAPFNFTDNARDAEIRQRFTSTSWDLKSFGKTFYGPYDGMTNDVHRKWEFTEVAVGGPFVFPPTFPGAGGNDPFRQELRELLQVVVFDTSGLKNVQRLLSVNGVLDRAPAPINRLRFRPLTPHPTTAQGITATPVAPNLAVTRPEELTGNPADQEWLARYDRMRMARDIYVILYTLGGGSNALNYTGDNSGRTLYSDDQLKEMAQFAVNVVDALDPDDTITEFVYDKNLGDGWDIDEYRYDDPEPPGAPDLDRGVVFGVERQTLAISEAMVLLAKRVLDSSLMPTDHLATEYDDREHRDFTYIELENVSPLPVDFAENNWQILVKAADVPSQTYVGERRLTLLSGVVQVGTGTSSRFTIGTAGDADNVDPMTMNLRPSYFMVAPDNNPVNLVRIAPRGTLDLDLLAPPLTTRYRVTKPVTFVGDGEVVDNTIPLSPAGIELLDLKANETDYDALAADTAFVEIQLRRRANLHRPEPSTYNTADTGAQHLQETKDNPWVVVDSIKVPIEIFDLADTDMAPEIQAKLEAVRSKEREQPLYGLEESGSPGNPFDGGETTYNSPNFKGNSLGEANDPPNATLPFTLWQPHFDRDFASITELFTIPLWGPFGDTQDAGNDGQQAVDGVTDVNLIKGLATRRLGSKFGETSQAPLATPALVGDDWNPNSTPSAKREPGIGTAGYRIQHPEGADSSNADPATDPTENRWFRALGLLEVPTRLERHADSPPYTIDAGRVDTTAPLDDENLGVYRTPGKINLNTLRYPEVLAAILDDKEVFQYKDLTTAAPNKEYLSDRAEGALQRDWWQQFVVARDGSDPITGLPLPGVPRSAPGMAAPAGSRPFRSLGFSQHGDVHAGAFHHGSLEHTVLRALGLDASAAAPAPDDRRRLFELGTKAEHDNSGVDYALKHRLLQKVMNNTTTRSNVFVIFIEVAFFEAREVVDGGTGETVVRIGNRIPSTSTFKTSYRGFFVVDRSKAMEQLRQGDLPDPAASPFISSFNQNFNYRSLVLYQRIIPE